jgi:hypothetical protein
LTLLAVAVVTGQLVAQRIERDVAYRANATAE